VAIPNYTRASMISPFLSCLPFPTFAFIGSIEDCIIRCCTDGSTSHITRICTQPPFSSHAFHFVDGFLQIPITDSSLPGHMFLTVNFWTISIHEEIDFGPVLQLPGGRVGEYLMNTTGHQTVHHVQFNYNYGQYFTIWDRLCGTYCMTHIRHANPLGGIRGSPNGF